MCRDRSTTMPSVSDCPLVPVPPPRGVITTALANAGSAISRRDACHIIRIQGKHRRLRQALINRVVGRQYRAAGVVSAELTAKAAVFQGLREIAGNCREASVGNWAIIGRLFSSV